MSNVKQVSELRTTEQMEQAVMAFKAASGWGQDVSQVWQAIRQAALEQFADNQPTDSIAGADSY